MKFKLYLILKYFFSNNKGQFRKTFLFQIIALFIGSFLIALTYGIMDGMEYEISEKIETFNYKYHINEKYINNSFDYLNSGKENIAELRTKEAQSIIINVHTFNYFKEFCSKINNHAEIQQLNYDDFWNGENCKSKACIDYNSEYQNIFAKESFIIVGRELADEYNLKIGDEITLSDIININPLTGFYLTEVYLISGIYSFNFINYDYNNVFISENGKFFKNSHLNYYFDDETMVNTSIENSIEDNESFSALLSAINIEKYIYVGLGAFMLLIASIMIFNNTIIMLLEKRKQYKLLNAQGLSKKFILRVTLLTSILVSFICSSFGYYSSFLIYYLNEKYNILKYLFIYSPFNEMPIIISFDKYVLNLTLVLVLTFLATVFAIYRVELDREGL